MKNIIKLADEFEAKSKGLKPSTIAKINRLIANLEYIFNLSGFEATRYFTNDMKKYVRWPLDSGQNLPPQFMDPFGVAQFYLKKIIEKGFAAKGDLGNIRGILAGYKYPLEPNFKRWLIGQVDGVIRDLKN